MKKSTKLFILAVVLCFVLVLPLSAYAVGTENEPVTDVPTVVTTIPQPTQTVATTSSLPVETTADTFPSDLILGSSAVYPGLIERTESTEPPVETTAPETAEPPAETETPTEDGEAEEPTEDGEGEKVSFFNRIWEYVEAHKAGLVNVGSALGIGVMYALQWFKGNSKAKKLAVDILSVKNDTTKQLSDNGKMVEGYNAVCDVVDGLTKGYEKMKERYEEYGKTEAERNRIIGELIVTNTAILDILMAVYPNSKNLPQGVKDLINIKYAHMVRDLDDDKKLLNIVEYLMGKNPKDFVKEVEAPEQKPETPAFVQEGSTVILNDIPKAAAEGTAKTEV